MAFVFSSEDYFGGGANILFNILFDDVFFCFTVD